MKTYSDIENHIKGKKVAIVGNASSIFNNEDGKMIDAYDVVIRMNYGFVWNNKWVAPNYIGTKTTIVAAGNAVGLLDSMHRYPNSKYLIHMSGGNRNETVNKHSNKYYLYPEHYWQELKNLLTARPSTGMMVFDMVEKSKPMHVSMFGFDWKQTRTYYNDGKQGRSLEESNKPIGPHHWLNERNYIIGKCNKSNWDII